MALTESRPRVSKTRKGPTASATTFEEGERKRGNDGMMWETIITGAGVHRWKRLSEAPAKAAAKAKAPAEAKAAAKAKAPAKARAKKKGPKLTREGW